MSPPTRRCASRPRRPVPEQHAARPRPLYRERLYPAGILRQRPCGRHLRFARAEYYIADHALSLLADSLGKKTTRSVPRRSLGYKHYYSPESGRCVPSPTESSSRPSTRAGRELRTVPGFHEGSAWNYTVLCSARRGGLAEADGRRRRFIDKLQMVFDEGLYDPANEPDIAYAICSAAFRARSGARSEVRRLLDTCTLRPPPTASPGNDDTGTMSAWAVFSMMGLYPTARGSLTIRLRLFSTR